MTDIDWQRLLLMLRDERRAQEHRIADDIATDRMLRTLTVLAVAFALFVCGGYLCLSA